MFIANDLKYSPPGKIIVRLIYGVDSKSPGHSAIPTKQSSLILNTSRSGRPVQAPPPAVGRS